MACACKVNQQLSYLEKKYGNKQVQSKETHISDNIKLWSNKILMLSLLIILSPFMFFYLIIKQIFGDGKINIQKLFKLN